jgi:hypothetical protein
MQLLFLYHILCKTSIVSIQLNFTPTIDKKNRLVNSRPNCDQRVTISLKNALKKTPTKI